jgi:hypothetical protein
VVFHNPMEIKIYIYSLSNPALHCVVSDPFPLLISFRSMPIFQVLTFVELPWRILVWTVLISKTPWP